MITLLFLYLKVLWILMKLSIWVCWLLVALILAMIATLTHHDRGARKLMHTANIRRWI